MLKQWGLIDTTTAGIFKKLLPISFTKQAFQAVASWDNPAEFIDWKTIPSFIFAIRSDLDNIVVARNSKSSENKSFRYLAIGK